MPLRFNPSPTNITLYHCIFATGTHANTFWHVYGAPYIRESISTRKRLCVLYIWCPVNRCPSQAFRSAPTYNRRALPALPDPQASNSAFSQ